MKHGPLTFAALEARIGAIPDGPSAALVTPRAIARLNVIGIVGVVIGLLPSLLFHVMDPKMWMLWMARIGLAITVIGFAPSTLRSGWLVAKHLWRSRPGMVAQMDHDMVHFGEVTRWLAGYSTARLNAMLRFAEAGQKRLGWKLGLLAGSMDRLGAIPLFAALTVLGGNARNLTDIPPWQALPAMFLAVTWLIAWIAAHMGLRMQLYATLLADAIAQK